MKTALHVSTAGVFVLITILALLAGFLSGYYTGTVLTLDLVDAVFGNNAQVTIDINEAELLDYLLELMP